MTVKIMCSVNCNAQLEIELLSDDNGIYKDTWGVFQNLGYKKWKWRQAFVHCVRQDSRTSDTDMLPRLPLGSELYPSCQGHWASPWRQLPTQGLTVREAHSLGLINMERQRPGHLALPGVIDRQHPPRNSLQVGSISVKPISQLNIFLPNSASLTFLPWVLINILHPKLPLSVCFQRTCPVTLVNIALRCWLVCL